MKEVIPGIGVEFFPKFLTMIGTAFDQSDMCIIECEQKETGELVRVLATININKVSNVIEFLPIAQLFDKNPMHGLIITDGAVLASQKPMEEWFKKSEERTCDLSQMN